MSLFSTPLLGIEEVQLPETTLVLVGPRGHGKSATGNTILEREAFISSDPVTCELQTTVVVEDGQTISVIDTPGFVDTESDFFGEEVEKCFHLARNRIHAFLFVVSTEQRISTEDGVVAVRKLQTIFGDNIMNYIILVFTGGDEVNKLSLPIAYDEFVSLCQGRYVLFDNETTDAVKRSEQVQNLLSQVETVISHNGGKPFMSQLFELQLQVDARLRDTTTRLEQQMEAATLKAYERAEMYLKEETSELIQRISKSYEEQMTQRLEAAVEQRVLDMTTRLEQQRAEAHAAQMRVNEIARLQTRQRINEEVEWRMKDVTTSLKQQRAEAHAAQMRVNETVQWEISELILQMTQSIKDEVESKVKDVTTRLEQQLAEAEAARLKADERAQEAQKNSGQQIQKPYWRFGVQPFMYMFMLILLLLWDQYRQTYSNVK